MSTPSALLVGSTGLVGSYILQVLRAGHPSTYSSIDIIARRSVASTDAGKIPVREFVDKDTSKWAPHISSFAPAPSTFFSGLATTRAAAGGFEQQYKLEHDVNLDLAKAAKNAGTKIYVLISSGGADANSMFGYTKMKGQLEENVIALGFDHTIIVRPGLIVGHREESRPAEAIFRAIASGLRRVHSGLMNSWAQDADVIAKAAVLTAVKAEKGEIKEKVTILGQSDIVRIGIHEWTKAAA